MRVIVFELIKTTMIYATHDNGGRPFRVDINPRTKLAHVSRNPHGSNLESFDIPYMKVWVGESPKNGMTSFSGGYGPEFKGNSILFQIKSSKNNYFRYVFVGERIFEFQTKDEVVKFSSPVGNSDVPYPFAVDKLGNRYLMIESVFLHTDSDEPYNVFYDYDKVREVQYPKKERLLMLWKNGRPRKFYYANQLSGRLSRLLDGDVPIYWENPQGEKVVVNKKKVKALFDSIGRRMGIHPFLHEKDWAARQ